LIPLWERFFYRLTDVLGHVQITRRRAWILGLVGGSAIVSTWHWIGRL
jgi:hypothetical protein